LTLPRTDPEVAARTLKRHLHEFWINRSLAKKGWTRQPLDDLHVVVSIPATRADGAKDDYYVHLGAEYYDVYPATVLLVVPDQGWSRARAGSPWWPKLKPPGWFGLHDDYEYRDPQSGALLHKGQLVCFSMGAEYYVSNHAPTDEQRWQQGRHTVAATLSRLSEVLSQPYYEGPDAPRNP